VAKDGSAMDSYFIRGTDKKYLIARVLYTDESMETDESTGRRAESVSLQLWIVNAPNATVAREMSPSHTDAVAEAQQPVAGFDIGRVMLIGTIGNSKKSFMMKCWRVKPSRLH
jgi:hypothetical protein